MSSYTNYSRPGNSHFAPAVDGPYDIPTTPSRLPRKHSRNYSRPHVPPSTEIINNLISSLDTVAQDNPDPYNIYQPPQTVFPFPSASVTPAAASPTISRYSSNHSLPRNVGRQGSLQKHQEPAPELDPRQLPFIDDAAEPPVVRTSKPPSGYSPLTSPYPPKQATRLESSSSLKNFFRPASKGQQSTYSVETTPQDERRAALNSRQSEMSTDYDIPRRDPRQRGLMNKKSGEKLRSKRLSRGPPRNVEPIWIQSPELPIEPNDFSPLEGQGRELVMESTVDLDNHILDMERPWLDLSKSPVSESSIKAGKRPALDVPEDSPSGRESASSILLAAVPDRMSSLRHQRSPTGRRSDRKPPRKTADQSPIDPDGDVSPLQEKVKLDDYLDPDDPVAKRIRELKAAQKEWRRESKEHDRRERRSRREQKLVEQAREKQKDPDSFDATVRSKPSNKRDSYIKGIAEKSGPTAETNDTKLQARKGQDPTLNEKVLLDEETRNHLTKARKVLGIPATPPESRPSSPPFLTVPTMNDGKGPNRNNFRIATPDHGRASPNDDSFLREYQQAVRMLDLQAGRPATPGSPNFSKPLAENAAPAKINTGRKSLEGRTTPSKPWSSEKRRPSTTAAEEFTPQQSRGIIPAEWRDSSSASINGAVTEFLDAPRLSQCIKHPTTGRNISFSDVGDPKGHVVICCVGMGLTRYVAAFYDDLASTLGLRLITPERPGVGDSEPYAERSSTPLSWPDDVLTICSTLKINRFSLLAHSAGAIYALATALRVPHHVKGRVHLLAPWIPPSQLSGVGLHTDSPQPPGGSLPRSQRFLRVLPTTFLKAANASWFNTSNSSSSSSPNRAPGGADGKKKRKSSIVGMSNSSPNFNRQDPSMLNDSLGFMDGDLPHTVSGLPQPTRPFAAGDAPGRSGFSGAEQRQQYDSQLTLKIWERATRNANPAVDLLVCLERTQPIGFRYVDIQKRVVIRHGTRDNRVPLDNVRWIASTMRNCELRVLDGEGHGLMSSASVMAEVLTELSRGWEDYDRNNRGGSLRKERKTVA